MARKELFKIGLQYKYAPETFLNRSNASALLAKSRACDRLQPRRER